AALYWNDQQPENPKFKTIPEADFESELLNDLVEDRFGNRPIWHHQKDLQSWEESINVDTPIERHVQDKLKPQSEDQRLTFCYASSPGESCELRSIDWVLDPANTSALKSICQNKIVLVGSYDPLEHDNQPTPLSYNPYKKASEREREDRRFGVEIHASIIHT